MHNPRLASRYAKSLMDISLEQNALENVINDMYLIDQVCKKNKDFVNMVKQPIIKADKKGAIIKAIFSGKISQLTEKFILLLINKGREQYLDEIVTAFIAQYRHNKKIRMVKLTTAAPVGDTVVDVIKTKLQSKFPDSTINIETNINPELLGGFLLDLGSEQMDASVIRDLNDIKKQFNQNLYVAKI